MANELPDKAERPGQYNLRRAAERCRRLARDAPDSRLRNTLLMMAEEYEGRSHFPASSKSQEVLEDLALASFEAAERIRKYAEHLEAKVARAGSPPPAPKIAEAMVGFFCTSATREAVLGDLAEKFEQRIEASGIRSARAWYWWQAARSFGHFSCRWARRFIELDAILQRIGF